MRRPPRPRPTKPSAVTVPSLLTDQRGPLVRRLCEAEKHFDALLAAVGQVARGTTPAEFAEMIEAQRAKIATIVQETGMPAPR